MLEALDCRTLHQTDRAPAEPRAGQARAVAAGHPPRRGYECVHLGDAHLVVVAQAGVRLVHQPAEGRHIAVFERRRAAQRPIVLGDHVPGAPADRLRQIGRVRLELLDRHIAQRSDRGIPLFEQAHCCFTFRPALVVGRAGQRALDMAIADDDLDIGRQRHRAIAQVAAIEQQRVVGLAERRDKLIHNPALDADERIFGPLGQQRQLLAQDVEPVEDLEGIADGNLERGRGREAGAARDIAGDQQVRAAERMAGNQERFHNAADVIAPGMLGAALDLVERELIGVGQVGGYDMHAPVVAGARGHIRRPIDRHRKDKTVVVVGMLADQIDTARRTDHQVRMDAVMALESIANSIDL